MPAPESVEDTQRKKHWYSLKRDRIQRRLIAGEPTVPRFRVLPCPIRMNVIAKTHVFPSGRHEGETEQVYQRLTAEVIRLHHMSHLRTRTHLP